jgi:hypothetical protein
MINLPGKPSLCIVFANNLISCPVHILDTLKSGLDPDCMIFGGYAASDDFSQGRVHQYCDTDIYSDGVSLLLLSGPVEIAFCLSNSWNPVGSIAVIDESQNNQVSRISEKSALHFYHDMFGPHPEPLLEMPLAIYNDEEDYYIRVANAFDISNEWVLFNGMIPQRSSHPIY